MPATNRLSRVVATIYKLPKILHSPALSLVFGSQVKFAGTAKIRVHELTQTRAVMSITNQRKVQNHIKGVHAAAMALLSVGANLFAMGQHRVALVRG
ncbi:DUF4442 domain-containing protein [Pseudomonas cavernicola]|uniref:DUF4442 domain-containing protein n=1 Tax=Pseudomonas cavernicola TaxID=2320866 RepID=UPI002367F228|nr:DUF4442 domain-containing protein [Pseudomonas cavernicola]